MNTRMPHTQLILSIIGDPPFFLIFLFSLFFTIEDLIILTVKWNLHFEENILLLKNAELMIERGDTGIAPALHNVFSGSHIHI